MTRNIYRYEFDLSIPHYDIEETLLLSVLAGESLHGKARVRLDATYFYDTEKNFCVIDAETEAGRDICKIFTGFCIKEFGETSFRVRRAEEVKKAGT